MTSGRLGPGWVVVVVLTLIAPMPTRAQSGYRAANGETSIVARTSGFARADFAEISLALQYVLEPTRGIGLAPYLSAAARKGQFDLFSAFDFNPGFEGGVLAFLPLHSGSGSSNALSARVGFRTTERKLFAFDQDSTRVSLTEPVQWDLILAAGWSLALGPRTLAGLGGSVRREWSSPGTTKAVEVCVGGSGPTLPLCTDRYPAPLSDYWAGQVRGDLIRNVTRLGSATSLPTLALFGSASADFGQDTPARFNLGLGIGVTTEQFAGQPIVVLFFEMYDITDAAEQDLGISDQLVTRVALTIPFALLAER